MNKSVCFIGHRKIENHENLRLNIKALIIQLIQSGVNTFIFGDRSQFNDICYDEVSNFKNTYNHIVRIHYRTNYPIANEYTMQFLIKGYEQSIFPISVKNSGKACYIKRNVAMIDAADICVFYYNSDYTVVPKNTIGNRNHSNASGTKYAYEYATNHNKTVINLYKK